MISYIFGLAEAFFIGELWGRPEVPPKSLIIDMDTVLSQNKDKDFSLKEKSYKRAILLLRSEKRDLENTVVEMSKYGKDMCNIVEQNHSDLLDLSQLIDTYKLKLQEADHRISALKLKLIEYDNLHKRQIAEIHNLQKKKFWFNSRIKKI